MENRIPKQALVWALLGLAPFVAQVILFILQLSDASFTLKLAALNNNTMHVLLIYSFALLCFLFGAKWGLAVNAPGEKSANVLYFVSVVGFLLIFAALSALFYNRIVFAVLAGMFAVSWALDWWTAHQGLCPPWYLRLRNSIAPIVIVCLISIQWLVNYMKF